MNRHPITKANVRAHEMTRAAGLPYVPALDGLRGVAALLVVGSHFGLPGFSSGGIVGVTLFFVLSGYLITRLLLAEAAAGRVDLARFYVRRAARLLPALALLLAGVGVALVVVGRGDVARDGVLASGLYVSNLVIAGGGTLGPFQHTWSLAIEEQFYLLWPAILIVGLRYRRTLLAVILLAIASAALLRLGPDDVDHVWWAYHHTATRGDALLVGCLLALVAVRPSRLTAVVAAAFLAIVVLLPIAPGTLVMGLLLPVAIAAAVVVGNPFPWLGARPLVAVGRISYGLYLWHLPIAAMHGPAWLGIAASFFLATASYHLLEQPIRRRASAHLILGLVPGRPGRSLGTDRPRSAERAARPAVVAADIDRP